MVLRLIVGTLPRSGVYSQNRPQQVRDVEVDHDNHYCGSMFQMVLRPIHQSVYLIWTTSVIVFMWEKQATYCMLNLIGDWCPRTVVLLGHGAEWVVDYVSFGIDQF